MKIISIKNWDEVPKDYTGIVKHPIILETYWYLNGKLHREDGPAIEHADGRKCWYLNGLRHRVDGPAVESADGSKCWYLNDEMVFANYSNNGKLSETRFYQQFVFFREPPDGKTNVKPIFFRFSIFDQILLIEKDIEQIIHPFKKPFLFEKYLSSDGILFFPQQTFEETE
jgi:hypothetical protein